MITPINFQLAKLLKEKQFNQDTFNFYTKPNSKMFGIDEHGRAYPMKNTAKKIYKCGQETALNIESVYSAPTITEVVMWLYEKHGIWISVSIESNEEDELSFYFSLLQNDNNEVVFKLRQSDFNSSTEAYSAAIEYCLKNLIK